MRCSIAVVQALVMHPRFKDLPWVAGGAFKNACGNDDYRYTLELEPAEAYKVIELKKNDIIKTQRSSGGWKVKDSRRISFWLLKALDYTGHLGKMLEDGSFLYDPFLQFRDTADIYGFVVRRDLLKSCQSSDARLGIKLTEEIFDNQAEDGSWNQTVICTCFNIEQLILLNVNRDDERLCKSVNWILDTFTVDVVRHSNNLGGTVVAHSMFTSYQRYNEFADALELKPEWIPRQLCYNHLPMIQTSEAIKTLIKLGFEEDNRIISACENFVRMKEDYGGWCDSNIRNKLLAEKKKM